MKALVIFGSTARNERSFDSDIDMLGVYDKEKNTICFKREREPFFISRNNLTRKNGFW
ncbi:hypothetical protein C7D74_30670 [Klebsiella pneumoniae]|nr:hypothetical protein C7D74_30670 [Klebsiella pneumoniae]